MNKQKYTFYCTAVAVEQIRDRIIKRNNSNTKGMRIGLQGGGCSGFSLIVEFADKVNDKDYVFEFDNIFLYIDPKSMVYLDGTTIEYEISLMGHGFKFNIPKQQSTCGCKKSINFKEQI